MINESLKSNLFFEEGNDQKFEQETKELVEKVISAVLCSFDSTTTNDDKQNALKFLENLKENHSIICVKIAFQLLNEINRQTILHHYGLHSIESIIKLKWNLLRTDERNWIKRQLFVIIKGSNLNHMLISSIYLRNSLAKCLVELIKRDCFEKVNNTLDEVVNMIQEIQQIQENNASQLELILLVYRFLNEELTIYTQSIQAQRRRQILNQIQKRLNDILPCLIRISNDLINLPEQYERLTQTCLLTVNSFLTWVEYNHFEQYELFLCELFLKFFQLTSVKLRHASFECLLSLVNKRLARKQLQQQQQQRNKRIASLPSAAVNCQQEKVFLNYLLGDSTLEMFYRLLLNPTDSIEQLRSIVTNDHLNCLKMLGQFLLKLSNYLLQLFQQLATKSLDDNEFLTFVNERTQSFLQYLLLLNQHPFHQLSLNSYQALNLFLIRQPALLSNEQFCLKLIFNLKQSLHRIHFPSTTTIELLAHDNEILRKQYTHNQQCHVYALFEYDSEEQFFWKFFSQYRGELQKFIKSFIGLFFLETAPDRSVELERNISCLKSILENLFVYLESLIQRTPPKLSTSPSLSLFSSYIILEWEALYFLLDHVLYIIRKELFSSASNESPREKLTSLLITEQFLRTLKYLLQFTPDLSEHIHGNVLNLLSCMFFLTQYDQSLAIQIIQRLLTTFQTYQRQSMVETNPNECEIIQIQSSNAFLYLCKNFPTKMIEYYSELFPFLCQLYKSEFQVTKTVSSTTVDELSSPTLKLLDAAQILFFYKLTHTSTNDPSSLEDFYELVKPVYEVLNVSLAVHSLEGFIEYLDLCSTRAAPLNISRYRRKTLMLALHCLCLLIRYSKQQQAQVDVTLHCKISLCLRPILFDYILKQTQFCNQLYDQQINPFYNILKANLTYSETERQLYLGTYESNNVAKTTITSSVAPSSLSMSSVRFQTTSNMDDQRLRDYLHRLFDICYQINGMYFAHDNDLYALKYDEENYFLRLFLQKILFENFHTLPSFRLRIVLRHFCRVFIENYCSSTTMEKETINELFLTFLDVFLPHIQQRLTIMWNNLLTTTTATNLQQDQCSDEVIEECVCVLITRDFVDIIRYFIFKTIPGQTNLVKKNKKTANERNISESMGEEINGELDQIEEWDETNANNGISNKLLNSSQEKIDYSDLFMYMIKMARQNSPLGLRLFNSVIQILFECLTFPDAYCINRFLPLILPITKLYTDTISKPVETSLTIDRRYLFQSLIRALERHNENEGVNTNLISLIGHIYELWQHQFSEQLDLAFHQTIPQLNIELLNTYKNRLATSDSKKQPQISERERRDTIKNLLNPLFLSPTSIHKKDGGTASNPFNK